MLLIRKMALVFVLLIVSSSYVFATESKEIELSARQWYNNAEQLMRNMDYENALVAYNKAIQLDPKYGKAYAGRAGAYGGLKKYDKEIKDLDTAIRLDSANADYYYYSKALTYNVLHDYKRAIENINKSIEIKGRIQYYVIRGYIYQCMENYLLAQKDYGFVREKDFYNFMAITGLAEIAEKEKRYEKAVAYYDELISHDEEYISLSGRKASLLLKLNKYKEVLDCVNKAIEKFPNSSDLYFQKCLADYHLRRFKTAIQDVSKAIEYANTDKEKGHFYEMRAMIKAVIYDERGAEDDIRLAIKYAPNDVDYEKFKKNFLSK